GMPMRSLLATAGRVAVSAIPAPALERPVTPLPVPNASAPALVPSPSLPIAQPSPSLAITPPTLGVSPDPTAGGVGAPSPVPGAKPVPGAPGAGGTIGSGGGGESGGRPSLPSPGVTLPLTKIVVRSPLDAALVVAVAL